jgi:hypothetical protein
MLVGSRLFGSRLVGSKLVHFQHNVFDEVASPQAARYRRSVLCGAPDLNLASPPVTCYMECCGVLVDMHSHKEHDSSPGSMSLVADQMHGSRPGAACW